MSEPLDPPVLLRVASMPFGLLEGLHGRRSLAALDHVLTLEEEIEAEARSLEDDLFALAGPSMAAVRSTGGGVAVRESLRPALLAVRRDVHNRRRGAVQRGAREIASEHPAVAERLQRYNAMLGHLEMARDLHDAHHAEAVANAAIHLAQAAREPLIEEGLHLASRSLFTKAVHLGTIPAWRWTHRERHSALKVLAYLARFASKTSPHGVFCSTALGRFTERAACTGENVISRRETLLAVGEARKIAACLAVDPALASMVVPRANPTLRERHGAWTFWRPASPRHDDDDEVLTEMRPHAVARTLLDCCAPGRTIADVIVEASRRTGIPSTDLKAFAGKLAASGLLIAEVEIPWSERRPLRWLAAEARRAGCAPAWLTQVEELEQRVDDLDSGSWNELRTVLDRIWQGAEQLPHHRALDHDALLRVDAASALQVDLPRGVRSELERSLDWYARLCAALYPRDALLGAYVRRFLERFPADSDVEALDVYHGVFEDREEQRPVAFPVPAGSDSLAGRRANAFARVRDLLAQGARAAGRDEVALETLDWSAILGDAPAPPWSCGVLFQVAAADAKAIDVGRYRLILNAIYPGGGLASARLAHLHAGDGPVEEGPLATELRASWSWLESDGAVAAEVSFMHSARTANAGLRPSLFRHEIELPGDRATPDREAIPLVDLVVRFDSAARRFVLRSRSRDVEVKPIVASGISPHGIVSFLIAIGQQDLQPLSFFPGFDVEGVVHWPRFTLGRTVVFRGRWVLPDEKMPASGKLRAFDAARMLEVARWRRRHGLPRHVFVHTASDPKPFYVDLESPWLVELWLSRRAESPAATSCVTEMLPGPEAMWVADSRGRYATEFLAHLQNLPPGSVT